MFDPRRKIFTLEQLVPIVEGLKREGKQIVTTSGRFDIIHSSHTKNLAMARRQGDVLIVAVTSDRLASEGDHQLITNESDRAYVAAAMRAVDYVFVSDNSPVAWIALLQPDVHVMGGSPFSSAFVEERRVVEENGGKVLVAPHLTERTDVELAQRIIVSALVS
ncbi:MAG: adenylyltransferase/cytidyltransferase family protein [bacterium]|nr:adenylyltransferase/cytidyltransferase family protein [bacterium]